MICKCCVSFYCIAKQIIYTYTDIHPFKILFPYRPLQSIKKSSLCYTVGPYCVLVDHSCQTLCDPVDRSPPGSSVHGVLQARILEWVAMPSSRGSSQSMNIIQVSYVSGIVKCILYHYCHLESPSSLICKCKMSC